LVIVLIFQALQVIETFNEQSVLKDFPGLTEYLNKFLEILFSVIICSFVVFPALFLLFSDPPIGQYVIVSVHPKRKVWELEVTARISSRQQVAHKPFLLSLLY
jgi:hypothetical protein